MLFLNTNMWKSIKNFLKQTFSLDEQLLEEKLDEQSLAEKPKEEILNKTENEVCCKDETTNPAKNQNSNEKITNDFLQTISKPNNINEPVIKQLKLKTNYRKDPNYRQ